MSGFEKKRKQLHLRQSMMQKLCYGALINNNIIMNKDGSLTCCFAYFGDDIQIMSEQKKVQICERYSMAASRYWQENMLIEADYIRYQAAEYPDNTSFPDPVSALIDIERQLQFEHSNRVYESRVYYTFTLREESEVPVGIKKMIIETDEEIKEKTIKERIQAFEERIDQYIHYVSHGRPSQYQRLSGDNLITYLNSCLTHNTRKVQAPKHKYFLDSYLAQDFIAGMEPVICNKKIRVVSVDMLPDNLHAMLMDDLNHMSMPFRFHSRFMLLSQSEATKYLKRLQRTWSSKAIGFMGMLTNAMGGNAKINQAAEDNHQDIIACMHENESSEVKFGWYNLVFVLMHEDINELNQQTNDLIKVLEHNNIQLRIENVNAAEAYLGSLPAHGGYNVRMNLMDSRVWAATLPLSDIYSGELHCPNPYYQEQSPALVYGLTGLNNIYHFNNSVGDVGHTLILGPTGAGKTSLLNLMMAQHRKYRQSRQIVLDCNYSSMVTVLAMDGKYIMVSDDGSMSNNNHQCQLSVFDGVENRSQAESIVNWFIDLFSLNGVDMTIDRQSEIRASVDRIKTLPKDLRRFKNMIFDEPILRGTFKELCKTVFGDLINGNTDVLSNESLLGVEIGKLSQILPERQLQPFLLLLLDKLATIFEDRIPTMLYFEEAWKFLDHPLLAPRIKEKLKTLRKFNVSVIFASQSLADVAECSLTPVLIESCPTKIFLPNANAEENEAIVNLYGSFGLSHQERLLIANSTPKKEYYITQPNGSRLVEFNLGEVALQFVSLDKESDRSIFLKFYNANNPTWLVDYLNEKKLVDAAEVAKQLIMKGAA